MAHELSFAQNGTAEAFYALKPAWHGLGTVLAARQRMTKSAHLQDYAAPAGAKVTLVGKYSTSQFGSA